MDESFEVPGKKHYSVCTDYLLSGRVHSYAHQIEAVFERNPTAVLEVGTGPGIVAAALKAVGIDVTTLDVQPELQPDIVGSVLEIPALDKSFDLCLCCQVLEHLPFESFKTALKELRRVTKQTLILSLPDVSRTYHVNCRLPLLPHLNFEYTRPKFRHPPIPASRFETMGHYWEIGFRGTSLARVSTLISESGWKIERTWRVPEKRWHRFFCLNT